MRRATLVLAALLAAALGCTKAEETGIEVQVGLVGGAMPALQKLEVVASSPNGFDPIDDITSVAPGVTVQTDASHRLVITFDKGDHYLFRDNPLLFQLILPTSIGVTITLSAVGRDENNSVLLQSEHDASATVVAGRMMVAELGMKCAKLEGTACASVDGGLALIKTAAEAAQFGVGPGKPPMSVAVCRLSDADTADLVIGVPTAQGNISSTSGGRVLIYRGAGRTWSGELSITAGTTGGPDIVIVGDEDAEQIGATLACGPLSGGPLDDLVIGAPQAAGGAGRVYVYSGAATATAGTTVGAPLPPLDGGRLLDGGVVPGLAVLHGPAAGAKAGTALAVARLGGSRPTLVVGAPGANGGAGAVYFVAHDQIVSPAGPPLGAGTGSEWPGAAGEQLGTALAAGPLAGTAPGTLDDVAIGAPGTLAAATVGVVYVLPAAQTANVTDGGVLEPAAVMKVLGPPGANVGAVLAIGDFNRDGFMDLGVGAPTATFNGIVKAGAVYVLKGDASFFAGATIDLADSPAPTLLRVIIGGQAESGFLGTSVAFVPWGAQPELRQGDLWLGAPGVEANRGMALLIAGGQGVAATIDTAAEGAAALKVLGVDEGDQLGKAVAAGSIEAGNATADLIVTAPGVKANSVVVGEVYGILNQKPK